MDVDELRSIFLFDGLDDDQLAQLVAAAVEVPFRTGQELFREGDPARFWWVLLEGRVQLERHAGREEAVVMMTPDRPGVWAGGFHAWDEHGAYLATMRGAGDGRMLRLPSEVLGELTRDWFPFSVHLIEGFFQTVRSMDTMSRQRESLIKLGQLAAGFTHELNNPVSAAARAVDVVDETTRTLVATLTRLAEGSLTSAQFIEMERLRGALDDVDPPTGAMDVADREDELAGWLEEHDVDDAWHLAPSLAAAGADVAWCDRLAAALSDATLGPGVEWVAGTSATRALLAEMREATSRVATLVDSMKSYSQLDRASVQEIDVTDGIESTLVVLRHKLPDEVVVERDFGDVPLIEAIPSELNQVWTNLIDNAVDAMEGVGTLRLSTRVDGDELVVEVRDTGPGMPLEVQHRAFEPFFTTKDVGRGTGLGLDISRRIVVDRHHGSISIDADDGGTAIVVRLPLTTDGR